MYKKSGHKSFRELSVDNTFAKLGVDISLRDLEADTPLNSSLPIFEIAAEIMHLSEIGKTNPYALIEHEKNQLTEHTPDDYFTSEWESLTRALTEAKKALESEEVNSIACTFYWLGVASARLDSEKADNEYHIKVLDSHIARTKSNLPFQKKSITAQLVKDIAIGFAKIYWREHESKEIHERPRMSDAAEFIHQKIKSAFSSDKYKKEIEGSGYEIPEDLAIIKNWLRPTAPSWAQRRGRPTKKAQSTKK